MGKLIKRRKDQRQERLVYVKRAKENFWRRKGAEQRANEKHEEEGKNVDKYEGIVKRAMKVGMKEGEGVIRGRGRYRLRRRCPRGWTT